MSDDREQGSLEVKVPKALYAALNMLDIVTAALRSTSDLVTAVQVETVKPEPQPGYYSKTEPYDVTREVVSRDWVAGRLIGMADMIEALTKELRP